MKKSLMLHLAFITALAVFLISFNISRVYGQCLGDQKALLVKLKHGLTFDSSLSTKLVRWDQNTDCCLWPGVSCDQEGRVLVLELDNETISSGIENSTSSLFDLQYLEKLNLAYNHLDAIQIPEEIYKLTNLKYLNCSYAGFAGQISMGLSRLTQLVSLDLSYNYFLKLESPDLKTMVGNLANLEELYLDDVNINLKGSEWCQALSSSLPQLRVLSMARSGISGLDPILLNLRFLAVISLDHNDLSSTDPQFLANFTKLTTLSLRSCSLHGSFPSKILVVPTLQEIDFSYNEKLAGTLPEFPHKSALKEVVLSYTGFTGLLPDSIANLGSLTRLNLRSCNFSGHIPSKMGNLTDLVHLDLSYNFFTGSIPPFHEAKKLKSIDLSYNNLAGPLSSAHLAVLLSLPSLQFLSVHNSYLSGEIHEFLNASSSILDTLDLSNNHRNGSIPQSIFKLKMLSGLSLSSNSFTGTVTVEAIKGLPRLTTLDLSYNNLIIDMHESNSTSFPFPVEMSNLRLASCQLQKFPHIKNQSVIFELDLSDNNIIGEIPSWVWTVGYLNLSHNLLESLEKPYHISTTPTVIDLSSNRIKGDLPFLPADTDRSVNWTSSITYFSLANNKLTGSIPSSICNLDLLFLDMSNNSINSKIPPCLFQKADRLVVLNVGRNNLSGIIPDTFSLNCNLRTLDLSSNTLEGRFPRSLQSCAFLEVLDIGNNKIRDTFPCIFKKLTDLPVLVLRSNRFHGNLQCPIANQTGSSLQIVDLAYNNFSGALLPQLFSNLEGMMQSNNNPEQQYLDVKYSNIYYQVSVTLNVKGLSMEIVKIFVAFTSIDFSCNNFQDEIPETLGDLKLLYHLNLSHNALTGTIPKAIGKLTKLESLDLSMNQLSGRISSELAGLTFLSFLNLSFNQLSGRIPRGNHLQTFSADSFEGNAGLCDFPLKKTCSDTKVNGSSQPPSNHSQHEIDGKYISFALGSSVSFGIIIWSLLHSQRYNELVDRLLFRIFGQHKRSGRNKNRRRSR